MNHMRQNVKDKLRSLRIPQGLMRDFLDDTFGNKVSSHFEAGLVDAKSESAFQAALGRLKFQWNNLERSCSSSITDPEFYSWFCKFKAEDIKCALPPVRIQAGADPHHLFTPNSSESLNHVNKGEAEWKNKLPSLISDLSKLAMQHKLKWKRQSLAEAMIIYLELQFINSFYPRPATVLRGCSNVMKVLQKNYLSSFTQVIL